MEWFGYCKVNLRYIGTFDIGEIVLRLELCAVLTGLAVVA